MNKKFSVFTILILVASLIISGCNSNGLTKDKYRDYYEIFVYSFCDSDGDGIGDLNGVKSKLSYVKELGFGGIYLMPVSQAGTYHKYDVIDYCSIDKEYGTIDDMKKLVNAAHKDNIAVIIDFVMNHTSSEHEWFRNACDFLSSLDANDDRSIEELKKECPYIGYYHFDKEKLNQSYYNVAGTKYYYEGVFWSEMPDLNYESEELRTEFENIARFWVDEIKVDGFRIDAALHFEEGDTNYNIEVLNWIYDYCKTINPDFYMVSEVWASESTFATYYQSKTDSMFNFDASSAEGPIISCARGTGNVASFVSRMKEYEDTFSNEYDMYIDAPFITNHDMGRVYNALMGDEEAMKYAGGLLMTMSGNCFVYYGEEIGMKSKGTKDENKRLPMLWSENKIDGMTVGPLDADKDIEQKFPAVDIQLNDKDSILNYYKKGISIRNKNPEIARGNIQIIDELTNGKIAAIIKTYNGSSVAILFNNSATESAIIDINETMLEKLKIVDYLTVDNSSVIIENNKINMPARSIVYLR